MATRAHISVKINEDDIDTVKKFNPNLFKWINSKLITDNFYHNVQLNGIYIKIYHHFDSYPDGLGKTLLEKYNTYDLALNLCLGGDYSTIVDNCFLPYYAALYDDWELVKPKILPEEPKLTEDYLYIFKNNKWYVVSHKEKEEKELVIENGS